MTTNRWLLGLVVLACRGWAEPGDDAGLGSAITLRVDAHGRTICGDIPLVSAAWDSLPREQRFPCDADHLVVIRDYDRFLRGHRDLAANGALRQKGRHALAFTITAAWPIYINLGPHRTIADTFDRSERWIAFAVAAVLAHERVHAMGNLSEAAGLLAELQLDRRFRSEGKLPELFDVDGLERQYRKALSVETR